MKAAKKHILNRTEKPEESNFSMGKSARLQLSDVRAVFRLVGECRELGDDPVAWRRHLLEGLCKYLGAKVAVGGEALGVDQGQFIPIFTVDHGWDGDAQRQAMFEWFEHQASNGPPRGLLPLPSSRGGAITVARRDVLCNRQWYGSKQFNDYLRRSEVDDLVVSFNRLTGAIGQFSCLTIFRALGEQKFSRRDARILRLLHEELVPLVGRQLAAAHEPGPSELSPRKRQTLDCLLEGDSDRQIAMRLNISKATVSEYVSQILRHFGVSSRAELLASFLRRHRPSRKD